MSDPDLGWYRAGELPPHSRPSHTTYTRLKLSELPPLNSVTMVGSFDWLDVPHHRVCSPLRFREQPETGPQLVERVANTLEAEGFRIPPAFRKFLLTPALHERVPSVTACYLDMGDRAVSWPHDASDRLWRFMNDQQSCIFWYLLLRTDGSHGVVAASPEWADCPDATSTEDEFLLSDFVVCARSFEEFILRFWIENSIWLFLRDKAPLSGVARSYLIALLDSGQPDAR